MYSNFIFLSILDFYYCDCRLNTRSYFWRAFVLLDDYVIKLIIDIDWLIYWFLIDKRNNRWLFLSKLFILFFTLYTVAGWSVAHGLCDWPRLVFLLIKRFRIVMEYIILLKLSKGCFIVYFTVKWPGTVWTWSFSTFVRGRDGVSVHAT